MPRRNHRLHEDPRGSGETLVEEPSDDDRVAVGGERHGGALLSASHRARADQLVAVLGPDSSAPLPDPGGPIAAAPSDQRRVAVGREGHRVAYESGPDVAG